MSKKIKTGFFLTFLIILITGAFALPRFVYAQSESPTDLINVINALRASQGLDAYLIDPWLMGYAQEHSDYQAATHTSTHLHSDGTVPQDIGLQENVAGGDPGFATADVVVNQIWSDYGHRRILVDYQYGDIGAGITLSDDGLLYITVNIRPRQQAETEVPTQEAPGESTPLPFVPYPTSTPNEDGMIIHIVQEGQSLWSIAQSYGVTVEEILQMNALPADSTDIYPGQQLLIRMGVTGTPALLETTPSVSDQPSEVTRAPITRTPLPPETFTPAPTEPLQPSPSPTRAPTGITFANLLKSENLAGWIILALGMIGLVLVILFGFRRSPK